MFTFNFYIFFLLSMGESFSSISISVKKSKIYINPIIAHQRANTEKEEKLNLMIFLILFSFALRVPSMTGLWSIHIFKAANCESNLWVRMRISTYVLMAWNSMTVNINSSTLCIKHLMREYVFLKLACFKKILQFIIQ